MSPASHATIPIVLKNVEKIAIDIADKKIELVIFLNRAINKRRDWNYNPIKSFISFFKN